MIAINLYLRNDMAFHMVAGVHFAARLKKPCHEHMQIFLSSNS
jgi:hypothetical protein